MTDATKLKHTVAVAEPGRSGELTSVWVPDEAHEAMRD
jgi:hypothetical protein